MKNEQIIASLSKVSAPADRKEAMLHSILEGADEAWASLEKEQQMNQKHTHTTMKGRKRRPAYRWLIPVAAVLVAAAVLMSIPRVSQAIKDWFYDAFRADRYLYVPAEERTHNPDFDSALAPRGTLEQTNEILLLSETDQYEEIDALRRENGHPGYDPADWLWLKDIRPEITDLYYDGVDFMVITFFACDPLPFMSGFIDNSISPMRLDILSFDIGTVTNLATGEVQELYAGGHGLTPQKDYRNEDGSANIEAMREDGGVWLYDDYVLPYQEQLAPGRYRIDMTHQILDDHVGEMSASGTVGVCKQSFVLDTTKALAAIKEKTLPKVAFSGNYPITRRHWGESSVDYKLEQVDLTGLSLSPRLQTRPTGLRVMLDYTVPPDWTKDMESDVLGGGLLYELIVDGKPAGKTLFIDGNGMERWIDIPITASERREAVSLVLRPTVESIQALVTDGVEHSLLTGYSLPNGTGCDPVIELIPIEGSDIVIPVRTTP